MSSHTDPVPVINNREKSRFEFTYEGHTAVSQYMDQGKLIVFTHTEVPEALEGNGIGSRLAKAGLDFARAEGKTVMPLCPYVAGYIHRHPEYRDLVLPGFMY